MKIIRQGFPEMIRGAIKFTLSILLLSILILGSSLIHLLIWKPRWKYALLVVYKRVIGCFLMKTLQVKLNVLNRKKRKGSSKPFMILCNHQTYLDTFIMSTAFRAVFIANAGLKRNFFVHALNSSIGNIFVERKQGAGMLEEIGKVTRAFSDGVSVILFPEGTTSDGNTLLPFRAPFVKSAVETGTDVLPVCIKYMRIDGRKAGKEEVRKLVYHGSMNIFRHLYDTCKNRKIEVDVNILSPIPCSGGVTRKQMTDKAFEQIKECFEKRV